MRKFFIIIPMLLATTGCASVGMSLIGSAASTAVSNVIGSSAERTFTLPTETVREGSLVALGRMGVVLRAPEVNENPAAIYGKAGDRPVEVELETLGENLTALRVTARRMGFLRDTATANEIIAQTERALETAAAEAAPAAKAPQTAAVTTAKAEQAPPVYVLNLEEVPAGAQRKLKPVPSRLQDYVVFTTDAERDGKRLVRVNLGYFSSEAEANSARLVALERFPNVRVSVLKGEASQAAAPPGLFKVARR